MNLNLSDWVALLSLLLSFTSLTVTAWLYRRMSASQIDDNIMNATNSILALLEKVKTLDPTERRLLMQWLNDWDYFRPPSDLFAKYKGPKEARLSRRSSGILIA